MKEFNELLKKLQDLVIIQDSGEWEECIPDDIWNECFVNNYKVVKRNLDVDTHRWYETSIIVLEINGGLLGIRYITNLFSESSSHEDCYHSISFHEMKAIQVTSYEIRNIDTQ